jgi:voltage-gated potassium channel
VTAVTGPRAPGPLAPAPAPAPPPATLRERVYRALEVAAPGDRASRIVDAAILATIATSTASLVLETVDGLRRPFGGAFALIEAGCTAVFTLEYAARLWSCTADPRYRRPVVGRLRFILSPLALIDLAAILPFYLPFLGIDLRAMRLARVVRMLRIAKLARYSRAFHALRAAVASRSEELLTILGLAILLVIVSAALMYHVEHDAQPERFPSIPAAMWWAVITLTTIGYGDVYPVTALGRLLGTAIAILGIGVVALPTGLLGAAFMEELQRRRAPRSCPHCGKEVESSG